MARNQTNQMPMEDCANACTELTTPLRVSNVPRIASRNVVKMSHTFHFFIMPRFSCIMTECRKAVPVSQGMQRGVLDRIPSPVAAPAEHGVGPVHAEEDAAGEEEPGHHGPAAGDVDPLLAGIAHHERAEREGERNGEADIAEVEHRRMDDHLGILQERVEPVAVGRNRAGDQRERRGGEVDEQKKEDLDAGEDRRKRRR